MTQTRLLLLFAFLASTALTFADPRPTGDRPIAVRPLYESRHFDESRARAEILQRIRAGVYAGYLAELCVTDPERCKTKPFKPYAVAKNGETTYELRIGPKGIEGLHQSVQQAVVDEILYYTWGHPRRADSPLAVAEPDAQRTLGRFPTSTQGRYLRFADRSWLKGGLGSFAYGPNCWYSSIAAVASDVKPRWGAPRFMGPNEFRAHMLQFREVETPAPGDVVRYYTDEAFFGGLVYAGEIHAAVYLGQALAKDPHSGQQVSEGLVLTKNGRSDLGFLMVQRLSDLDKTYLVDSEPDVPPGRKAKRRFFRVAEAGALEDPAIRPGAPTRLAYQADCLNYRDRWACLAGKIPPPPGARSTAYDYPTEWITLDRTQR